MVFRPPLLPPGIDRFAVNALRYGALFGVSGLVVDMGDLAGLWRVASFLGLGLSLVAIGFVYQRFVFPTGRAVSPPGG